jgi:ketosteroid isomerase-like protein
MSQENAENVRRAFEAWFLRGDSEEALARLDPDIVYKPAQEEAVQGLDAALASWERWQASWQEQEVTLEETIDAGDHVIQAILFRGRGRGSGVEVEGRFFQVLTIKDGKAVRWEEFSDRAEALKAAGLSE